MDNYKAKSSILIGKYYQFLFHKSIPHTPGYIRLAPQLVKSANQLSPINLVKEEFTSFVLYTLMYITLYKEQALVFLTSKFMHFGWDWPPRIGERQGNSWRYTGSGIARHTWVGGGAVCALSALPPSHITKLRESAAGAPQPRINEIQERVKYTVQ